MFPNETKGFSLQTFIVKTLIISDTENRHIYTQTERRGKGLAVGGTERERVCVRERRRVAENGVGVHCKNGHWRVTDHSEIVWDHDVKIALSRETILMGEKDYKDTLRL
jgi:hypothetical protein